MDVTEFRILHTLSSNLGHTFSINQLTDKIRETHGTAYYANIYNKLRKLASHRILNLKKLGNSSIVELDFGSYLLQDLLAEMEMRKKREVLDEKITLQLLLHDMSRRLHDTAIKSISAIDMERNLKLNKIEYFCLLQEADDDIEAHEDIAIIHQEFHKLQTLFNIRIESLLLTTREFSRFLESDETNPLKEALSMKTVLFCPQAFWNEIRAITEAGTELTTEAKPLHPADILERDLSYNLARFGYTEFGSQLRNGRKICIESIIIALLMQDDVRRLEAIPIIMAKYGFNSNLLVFLSQKYNVSAHLLGLLNVLANIAQTPEVNAAIHALDALHVTGTQADENSILEKMRLYNAV